MAAYEAGKTFRVGWFADLEALGQNPVRLAELQASVGVNMVLLESHRFHTGGYRLSDEVWRASPLRDWRERPLLVRHRQMRHLSDEAFAVLPGILGGADDSDLHVALEAGRRLGVEMWGHAGLWSYGAIVYPELALRDLKGQPLPPEEEVWGDCFCPSKPHLNAWVVDSLREAAARYPTDGIELDHARYLPPASIPNLLACACPDCTRQAAAWGIDLPGLADTIITGWKRIQRQPAATVQGALDKARTPLEALDVLLGDSAASRWFHLRARFLSDPLAKMAKATREAAARPFRFGIDVFPPSVALLGGHTYGDLASLDFFMGGFGLIGWGNAGPDACREWTRALCRQWPALEERRVLRSLYRLFGYEGLSLPETTQGLDRPTGALLAQVQKREVERLAQTRPQGPALYPPVNLPSLDDEGVRMVCAAIVENGLDGVMLGGLERLSPERGRILTKVFGRA
ncbi:MAG: hypothetical protein IT330_02655 [Anaerolineae bacterium]|nr:hypothetical protein [Anaerolineae bacterium]